MAESVQLKAIGKRRSRKSKAELPLAQRLPSEILLHIFNQVPRVRAKPSSYITGQVDPMRHIPRVCKSWFGPATEVLYKFVCVPRVNSAMLFHRTLTAQAHPDSLLGFLKDKTRVIGGKKAKKDEKGNGLGELVKILLLPKRVWVGCPPRLLLLFSRIINACGSLQEVQVITPIMCDDRFPHQLPRYALPIPINRHKQLKVLALANAEPSLWTNFPLFGDQFPELEELCLSGFRISPAVQVEEIGDGSKWPKLRTVRLESCDIGSLEAWLCQCPKLKTLEIDLSVWNVGPNGGIFARDCLESLQWSRTSTPIDLKHIKESKQLTTLTIDWNTFRHQWEFIPPHIAHLFIIFREADTPSNAPLSDFFGGKEGEPRPSLEYRGVTGNAHRDWAAECVSMKQLTKMTIRIAMANPWIIDNQEWLRSICQEKEVILDLDLTKFGPLPVKPAANLWHGSAQRIRRFTKPERASELDWEQQYRKKSP